jgi:hypothetical protein
MRRRSLLPLGAIAACARCSHYNVEILTASSLTSIDEPHCSSVSTGRDLGA